MSLSTFQHRQHQANTARMAAAAKSNVIATQWRLEMAKPTIRTTTTARVTVEVEVITGSWGEQCKLDQVYQQASEEAEGMMRRLFADSHGKAKFLRVKRIEAVTTDTKAS